MCAYQEIRNVSFSENFYVSTKWMNPIRKAIYPGEKVSDDTCLLSMDF